jgi:hypothetical protein
VKIPLAVFLLKFNEKTKGASREKSTKSILLIFEALFLCFKNILKNLKFFIFF